MKYPKTLMLALLAAGALSCENTDTEELQNIETSSIVIDNVVYHYQSQLDPETGQQTMMEGQDSGFIRSFFTDNEGYVTHVNLDNGQTRYYTNIEVFEEHSRLSSSVNGDAPEIENPDANDFVGGLEGGEGGVGSGGSGSGSGNSGGNSGSGSASDDYFPQCPTYPFAYLSDASAGRGNRKTMRDYGISSNIPDFRSYPAIPGDTFNDVLTSFKICRAGASKVEIYLYEDINYGGKLFLWSTTELSDMIPNMNRYLIHPGFLGVQEKNWDNEVSSAKFVSYP